MLIDDYDTYSARHDLYKAIADGDEADIEAAFDYLTAPPRTWITDLGEALQDCEYNKPSYSYDWHEIKKPSYDLRDSWRKPHTSYGYLWS